MDNLDVYDKHFTVHNYASPEELLNINYEDFVPMWNEQYPNYPWSYIEVSHLSMVVYASHLHWLL